MLKLSDTFTNFEDSNLFCNKNLESLFDKVAQERKLGVSGYYDLPNQDLSLIFEYLEKNKDFLKTIKDLIIIGIGGSSLGTKAIDKMLSHQIHRKKIKVRFLEHTDPVMILKELRRAKWEESLFIVISKSGSTIETTSIFKYILNRYGLLKSERKKHLLTITDENSPLFKWSKEEKIESFTIKANIGGRFSVLSTIGLLPLAILGYNIKELLQGAKYISDSFFNHNSNQILKKALFLVKNENTYPMNVLFSYGSVFTHFNNWYVQLWGESLGKLDIHKQRRGLTPIALIGSIDQHSFLQLIVQGPKNKTVTFLSVDQLAHKPIVIPNISLKGLESTNFVNNTTFNRLLKLQAESTKESIINQNIPVDSIKMDRLYEESVGELIFYFELLTSCVGCLLQIETYNQPGVEFGKKILREKFTHS